MQGGVKSGNTEKERRLFFGNDGGDESGRGGTGGLEDGGGPGRQGEGQGVSQPICVEHGPHRVTPIALANLENVSCVCVVGDRQITVGVHGQLGSPGRARSAQPDSGRFFPGIIGFTVVPQSSELRPIHRGVRNLAIARADGMLNFRGAGKYFGPLVRSLSGANEYPGSAVPYDYAQVPTGQQWVRGHGDRTDSHAGQKGDREFDRIEHDQCHPFLGSYPK